MCGIAGALDPAGAIGSGTVEGICCLQHHRGPDARVCEAIGPFVLGNTRLAIQDPTPSANQPFADPSGRFVVVFNGEIYNFRELIAQHSLEMRTGCDTEVVPLLWARYGARALRLLRGMYSVAVADLEKKCLFVARDPFGMKPLYWRRIGGGIVFASEVRPLRCLEPLPGVDPAAMWQYLRFGAVGSDRSPFEGVMAVPAGSCLRFDLDGTVRTELEIQPVETSTPGSTTSSSALAECFRESVRLHLEADVPTALLLSAGIDSSLVALAARDLGVQLHCLTVTGVGSGDESEIARRTAAVYGHAHQAVEASVDASIVDDFLNAMQRPTIDGLNTFVVCRAVNEAGFKVALSGLGGDEMLGGYSYARLLALLPALGVLDALPARLGSRLGAWLGSRLSAGPEKAGRLFAADGPRTVGGVVALQRELFEREQVSAMLGIACSASEADLQPRGREPEQLAFAELAVYLGPMLLPDADAFSMASSVELRVPFVDTAVMASAIGRKRIGYKKALVAAMGDRYLERLSARPKTGFALPMAQWMRSGALSDVLSAAREPDAPVWRVVDPQVGRPMLAGTIGKRWSEAWSLAALDGWLRTL